MPIAGDATHHLGGRVPADTHRVRPLRILAMLHLYAPHHCAGAEMAAHALLRGLVQRGHTVDVVLSRHHPEISAPYALDGVRVHPRIDKGDPIRWLADPALRPHVIIAHLENVDRASILGGLHGVPVVHLLHNTHTASKIALLRRPALIVANSRWMRDDITAWWTDRLGPQAAPPPLIVVPPLISPPAYRVTPGRHVTLVNVSDNKGADIFYGLAERFRHVRFLGVAGAYGDQVRRELPNVLWQDHIPGAAMRDTVYRKTRVLLMPSIYESYGRVAMEGACSGIPTIAHPTPGLRESLGQAGLFADRDDLDAWAAHLEHLSVPANWTAASHRSRARADALTPDVDCGRWVTAVEAVAAHDSPGQRR